MKKLSIALFASLFAVSAFAQVKIKGNTDIQASQNNTAAVAIGKDNTAKNTAGAIKGETTIQGNTKIKASQNNTAAVAIGKGNTAANEAGVIGGK